MGDKGRGKNAGLVQVKDLTALEGEVLTEHHESQEVTAVWVGEGLQTGKEAGKLAERANPGNLALERFSCMRSLSWSL